MSLKRIYLAFYYRGPPYQQPLLNFVWLLILAIEHKQSLTAFSILVEKYKPSLMR